MTTQSLPKCPLCDRTGVEIGRVDGRDAYVCRCPACGNFIFTPEVVYTLETADNKPKRFILSALTRRASDQQEKLELLTYNVKDLLENTAPPKAPGDVIDRILIAIHDATSDAMAWVRFPYADYTLYFLRSTTQLGEFLSLIDKLNLIEYRDEPTDKAYHVRLSLTGWDKVSDLRKVGRSSSRAFVAMSFSKGLDVIYEQGIEPALKNAGWTPVRMDRMQHNERIDDKIVAEIKRAGMVVADFTDNKQGVYFEAGLAAGLGIPVVWTVRDADLDYVHFDTRQYNHIVWRDALDLREQLYVRILATVGTAEG